MTAVYKRELKSLFCGMIAPVFMGFFLLMAGVYMSSVNFDQQYSQFEYAVSGLAFIFLIIVPILTMRSFSEERATKTDQLLYSLPIKTSAVVCGKYLAMVSVLGLSCLIMCLYPLILSIYGTVYFPTAYATILAFFLMGSALIAIGMFISSLTESQVISAVLTIGALLLLYLISNLASMIPATAIASFGLFIALCVAIAVIVYLMTKNFLAAIATGSVLIVATSVVYIVKSSLFESAFAKMLTSVSLFERMGNFIYGLFDLSSVVYYISVIVLFAFLTVQSVDKKRWS